MTKWCSLNRGLQVFFIIFLLNGCAYFSKKKIDSAASLYPKERYLTATGIGRTENEAKGRAVAEMSRIFEARVISDTRDYTLSVIGSKGEEYKQRIESSIEIISRVSLKGVEVSLIRFDPKKKMFYALSVLEKGRAREEWLSQQKGIDAKIEGKLQHLQSVPDSLTKLNSLKEIISLWIEREAIASRLRIIGYKAENLSYDIKKIFKDLSSLQSKLTAFIDVSGDYSKEVWEKIAEMLGNKRVMISKDIDNADIIIKGSVYAKKVDIYNPGWKYARVTLALTIKDNTEEKVIGEITESKREAQPSYNEAVHRALRKLFPEVMKKLGSFF